MLYDEALKYGFNYNDLKGLDLNELIKMVEQRKKGLAYEIWKNADLISLGIANKFRKANTRSFYPTTPEEASPELYPPKPSLKLNVNLNKKYNERS